MKTIALALLLSFTVAAHAVEKQTEHTVRLAEGEAPEEAGVEVMAWLAGRWTGDGLGGRTEETWSPPDAGAMIGTFRLIREDKPVFYEFMMLTVTERGLAMRLKHFNHDMTGWEEPKKFVEFRYVRTAGKLVQFEGLTFRRDGDDRLTIFLALRSKDVVREEKFEMTRAK
jgi:hypothetical protein